MPDAHASHDVIEKARRAFDVGDYREARRLAKRAKSQGDSEVANQASALIERTTPAPLSKYLLLLTTLLLLAVTYFGYSR